MRFLLGFLVAALLALGCGGDDDSLVINRSDGGAAVRGAPVNIAHGALSFSGDRPLVICHGNGCGGAAVRGAPPSPQQRADMLPACEPDGTGMSWGLYVSDALYCTVARDTAHPWGSCSGLDRGRPDALIHGCRTVALEGLVTSPNVVIRRNIACVRDCVTGAL